MNYFPHIPEIEQQKEWFCLWQPIVNRLMVSPDADKSNLIAFFNKTPDLYLYSWQALRHITEFGLSNAVGVNEIFSRKSTTINPNQNGSQNNNDEIIKAMFAELEIIPGLVLFGFNNVIYCRENSVDFIAALNGVNYGIEVTYVSGPNFKTQERVFIGSHDLYQLGSKKLINRLKSKYQEKERQVTTHNYNALNSIIIIKTDLFETYYPWLEHEQHNGKNTIQSFVDSCKIPTIVWGGGLSLYMSEKLSLLLPSFDKNQYIKLAYGLDVKNLELKIAKDAAKAEESFWKGYRSI